MNTGAPVILQAELRTLLHHRPPPQRMPLLFLCPDPPPNAYSLLGDLSRTDYGGRHGPSILEALALVLIQTEIGMLVLQVGWGWGGVAFPRCCPGEPGPQGTEQAVREPVSRLAPFLLH